jgi:hypothetical protein
MAQKITMLRTIARNFAISCETKIPGCGTLWTSPSNSMKTALAILPLTAFDSSVSISRADHGRGESPPTTSGGHTISGVRNVYFFEVRRLCCSDKNIRQQCI